jgi:hypothetical protein
MSSHIHVPNASYLHHTNFWKNRRLMSSMMIKNRFIRKILPQKFKLNMWCEFLDMFNRRYSNVKHSLEQLSPYIYWQIVWSLTFMFSMFYTNSLFKNHSNIHKYIVAKGIWLYLCHIKHLYLILNKKDISARDPKENLSSYEIHIHHLGYNKKPK